MLSEEGFDQWYRQLGLIDQAKTVITRVRTSNPSRRVQSSAGNVSGTYSSLKMGFAIQFESHKNELPLEEAPDLVHQWKICYTRTVGCVRLLKNWLTKALREAVESGEKTISPALLLKHAASAHRCDQYITDIEEGESSLNADPRATERLMERLGLNTRTRRAKESPPEDEDEEAPKQKTPAARRRVGQRNPTRDEVKKEATGDE